MNAARSRYPASLIAIHWLTAALVAGAWLTSEGGRHVVQNPPLLHFAFGIAVLALLLPRLLLRFFGEAPAAPAGQPGWLGRAAKAGHIFLYLMLVAVPLSGWIAANCLGVDVGFPGLHLPALAASTGGKAGLVGELHENGGNLLLIFAGLHMAMALWHQFVRRDGTLAHMGLRRRLPSS